MKIDILNKAIFVIDHEQEELREVESKGEFDTYIKGLINNINENETTRLFKIRRETTEVVNCVENIAKNSDNIDEINKYCKNIANKLLNEEIKVQKQIEQLRTSIKKGSLLEVLLHDTENDIYSFLIAKVEHKSFFDDVKFERRTGYSTEDNKLWKSCLFKFEDIGQEIQIQEIKVFLDNNAKYWTDNFLEIDPMNSDDLNTNNVFKMIELTLTRNIKKIYPKDYTTLRNSVICYFRSNEMFDFDEMYTTLFEEYNPIEMEKDVYTAHVIDKVRHIKESDKFDNQFKINQKIIKAKVKKVYEVNNNIEIKIMDGIENLDEIINSYEDSQTGEKFIKIKTNNEETYNSFRRI